MSKQPEGFLLKRLLLLFWATWFSIVFLTNLLDACKGLGVLPQTWAFASSNYAFVAQTTAIYGTPDWVNAVLFAGVLIWEAVAAVCFWRAALTFRRRSVYAAFTGGLSLWAAFLLADEVFIAYAVEATHFRILIAHLATLLVIELVPDPAR